MGGLFVCSLHKWLASSRSRSQICESRCCCRPWRACMCLGERVFWGFIRSLYLWSAGRSRLCGRARQSRYAAAHGTCVTCLGAHVLRGFVCFWCCPWRACMCLAERLLRGFQRLLCWWFALSSCCPWCIACFGKAARACLKKLRMSLQMANRLE